MKRPVDHTQKGTPYGVGVHVQDRHSGIVLEDVIGKEVGSNPHDHIDIFYGGWLSSSPFSGIYIIHVYIYIYKFCFLKPAG